MLKISLYQNFCVSLCEHIKTHNYRKNQSYTTDRQTTSAIGGRLSQWQKPCIPYALPCRPSEITRTDIETDWGTDGNDLYNRQLLGQALRSRWDQRSGNPSGSRTQADNGLFRRRSRQKSNRERQAKRCQSQGCMGTGLRQEGIAEYIQGFFIRIGARYRRIRKRPKGQPSPQLYAYKTEKLQELENQAKEGRIDIYYADESHVCTEGYVPYGWQFKGEDVYIASQKIARLNIFGMISRDNRYNGFSTTESITAEKVADYLDKLSFKISKDTFVVLDNASVHRNAIIKELRPIWEKRGLFLFYLPPYSPHLNIAETLWRVLKGKWLRPIDYTSTDTLFYATNRALAAVGTDMFVNYSHMAA